MAYSVSNIFDSDMQVADYLVFGGFFAALALVVGAVAYKQFGSSQGDDHELLVDQGNDSDAGTPVAESDNSPSGVLEDDQNDFSPEPRLDRNKTLTPFGNSVE